jgi:hypothetical protein
MLRPDGAGTGFVGDARGMTPSSTRRAASRSHNARRRSQADCASRKRKAFARQSNILLPILLGALLLQWFQNRVVLIVDAVHTTMPRRSIRRACLNDVRRIFMTPPFDFSLVKVQ